MSKLRSAQLHKAEHFLSTKARTLDYTMYLYHQSKSSEKAILNELKAFQNKDGGFGHGLEPDLQLPASSVLATTFGLQYCVEAKLTHEPIIKQAVHYLICEMKQRDNYSYWNIIPEEAEQFPRAPWWNFISPTSFNANPSIEVIAYLLLWADALDSTLLNTLTSYAVNYILSASSAEQHELLCMLRLYDQLPVHLQSVVHSSLSSLISRAVEVDPARWHLYGLTPLSVVQVPDSPFSHLFSAQLIEQNLAYIVQSQHADGSWHPAWSWGQYETDWAKAKLDWQGLLTYRNLLLLQRFNYIED